MVDGAMKHHLSNMLFYAVLSLGIVASQTWWYPRFTGWGRTVTLWVGSAIAGGLIYSVLFWLWYRRPQEKGFSERVSLIVVLLTAAAIVGVSRAFWIAPPLP